MGLPNGWANGWEGGVRAGGSIGRRDNYPSLWHGIPDSGNPSPPLPWGAFRPMIVPLGGDL